MERVIRVMTAGGKCIKSICSASSCRRWAGCRCHVTMDFVTLHLSHQHMTSMFC